VNTCEYMVGATMVLADRQGPYEFCRRDAGQWVQVPCVCDRVHLVCAYHAARGNYDPAVWEPVPNPENENVQGKS
jgi:hypothetical protein